MPFGRSVRASERVTKHMMSSHLSRRRRTRIASAVTLAASFGLAGGSAARASLTLNMRFANGGTTMLIGGDQTNTDIPIQVWATVTGSAALSPVPVAGTSATDPQVQTGTFDGLQYVYYNVVNSNSAGTYISGGIDTASGKTPTLNPYLGFNANGSQLGAVQNIQGGVSVGSTSSITSVAKPRGSKAIFDNASYYNQSAGYYQELGNDGIDISASGTSASFLLETLYFKPTAFSSLTKTTFSVSIPSAAFTASAAADYAQANWFEDVNSQNLGTGKAPTKTVGGVAVSATNNSSPSIGTSLVIQDTLAGDANLDGSVNFADLLIVAQNYQKTGTTFATGDFNADGTTNFADLLVVAQNYNTTISPITPSDVTVLTTAGGASFMTQWQAAEALATADVPEPAGLALLGLAGSTLLGRRKLRTSDRQ
jgi:hypothetical protein